MSENEANPSDSQPNPATSRPVPTGGARFVPPSIEELNRVLPQYEFVELIGAGGMGAVYKARQPKLNRFVAIKILPPIPDDELGFAERFEREAQSMAQLSHPHIVSVYDFGETSDGHLYFVMEFVEGSDLHQLISSGLLTLDHFYGWIPQVCDAIQYAHDHGIVHRDIKPANILIDREGRVKIADFGLAKLTGPDHQQSSLTQTNLSMGTPDYAAPEQIDGEAPVDWRSDIYSLGVVMYQMLTGRLPRGAFPLPSENTPGVDRRLDEVVLKAMQSEPAFRFQRASEIAHRLSEIWSQPDSATKATSDVSNH
ncbi:MAG: serine/threonine protein kinase, partial [Verrucomicrobiae bacterium]|nr:serine/threonine protein kinase [Verrucomicrobiae bacterium]